MEGTADAMSFQKVCVYDFIGDFLHKLKEDIGETISIRYVREITDMKKIDDDDKKVLLLYHT